MMEVVVTSGAISSSQVIATNKPTSRLTNLFIKLY